MEYNTVMENISFQMVSSVHEARTFYLQAVQAARGGEFEKATDLIESGDLSYQKGHAAHTQLLQMEAAGQAEKVNLLILHAEDQLMSTVTLRDIANEMIENYRMMFNLKSLIDGNLE